ncbi:MULTISPECIES: hypothetical protein [Actinoplanes]|uniref:hypothetical protein n=1 Tax=Actinoplanes TaxID=1865 RepID=UPI0005F2D884|nr:MULTISPECIES: hypothetical protein [Actinoplanes]
MPGMWWVVGVVALTAIFSAYLGWTAQRVERVHMRAQSAERALDAHLVRRAAAAAVVAEQNESVELYAAARLALDAEPGDRETAENDLTRQLQAVTLDPSDPAARALINTSRRVVLARQVHTDQVRDAQTARDRVLVRMLLLNRRYRKPEYFDIVEPVLPDLPPLTVPAPASPSDPPTVVASGA